MKNKMFTLRDFIDIPDKNMYESADCFQKFIDQMDARKAYAFDIISTSAIGARMNIIDRYGQR